MLLFTLANERQRKEYRHRHGPIQFGRLSQGECARIVVEDPYTSRDQLLVEELAGGDVHITNLGSGPVTLPDATQLAKDAKRRFTPPLRVVFGRTTLDIGLIPNEDQDHAGTSLQTISKPLAADSRVLKPPEPLGRVPSADTLAQWFETLLTVQRAAAGSSEFYADTARAVVDLVGLDRGMVLLWRENAWSVVANVSSREGDDRSFSMRVLRQVQAERRTFFQSLDATEGQSLVGIEAVVASPVFDEHDAVVGVVYGSRDMRDLRGTRRGIEPLEAQFVQLLAGAVSAGLARVAREADAARARVQFEQFFSPELARALELDPGVLAAKDRELTILFADLRGFSKISERIGASETYSLLSDILNRLTNQVMDHGGVVIDYYGDGLAAMWNAPTELPQHADHAVQAAVAMIGELPAINSQWAERLGGIVRLGVGLNTGQAQVGNSGSHRRLKYGPRGHAVNLTSRVEAATKVFGVSCLLTAATRHALSIELPLRRLCQARLTGLVDPVDLFELPASSDSPDWQRLNDGYHSALALYEEGQAAACRDACQVILGEIGLTDAPTKWLLAQAEQRLAAGDVPFPSFFAVETK